MMARTSDRSPAPRNRQIVHTNLVDFVLVSDVIEQHVKSIQQLHHLRRYTHHTTQLPSSVLELT